MNKINKVLREEIIEYLSEFLSESIESYDIKRLLCEGFKGYHLMTDEELVQELHNYIDPEDGEAPTTHLYIQAQYEIEVYNLLLKGA